MGFLPEYYACIEAQDSAYHLMEKIEKVLTEHSGYVRAEEGSLEYIAEKPLLIHQSMPLLRISIQQGEERVWAHFFFSFSQRQIPVEELHQVFHTHAVQIFVIFVEQLQKSRLFK